MRGIPLTKNDHKKVAHVMAEFTYDVGVPAIGARIACIFEKYISETHNRVLVIKEIGQLSGLRGHIPPIIKTSHFSVFREILCFKPDVLILHQYFGSPFGLCILVVTKLLGIRTIVGLDLSDEHAPRFKKFPSRFLRDIFLYISMLAQLLLMDKAFCRTQNEIDLLSNMPIHKDKFVVVPIPLPQDFKIGTSRKGNYLLAVSGWWSDRKNLHTALRVFSEVIKYKKCRFIVVGRFHKGRYRIIDENTGEYTNEYESGKEYEQKIMALVKELKIDSHVIFLKSKVGKELQELYKKALIYYMPSKSESFGTVWIEAMATGTPIVAMPVAGVKYVIKDGVTGFLKSSQEDQINAILELFTNHKLYKKIQRNCLVEAKRYEEKNVAKKWWDIIKPFDERVNEDSRSKITKYLPRTVRSSVGRIYDWTFDRKTIIPTLVKKSKARRIMEIGTYNGVTAEKIINAALTNFPSSEIEYWGFDIFGKVPPEEPNPTHEIASKAEVRARLSKYNIKIHLIEGNTRKTLPKSIRMGIPKMDFIFIDGGHSYETVKSDWENVNQIIHGSSIVVFDDIYTHYGPTKVVEEIKKSGDYVVEIFNRPFDKFFKPATVAIVKKKV